MEVILLKKVRNLGDLGKLVKVKAGYAANYLIPNGIAVTATKENVALFESKRAEFEAKEVAILNEAESRASKLKDFSVTIKAMASEEGKLYGSVGSQEIAEALASKGHQIQKREVLLPNGSIHYIGEYDIDLQLHSDVKVTIKVLIEAS